MLSARLLWVSGLAPLLVFTACSRQPGSGAQDGSPSVASTAQPLASSSAPAPSTPRAVLAIGAQAPDFDLPTADGKRVQLSSFRGKTVVLEWFNPDCPYVKASHTKGSLRDTAAKRAAQGVVWLAMNSAAPGKQGHGGPLNQARAKEWNLTHPVLLDEDGTVGRAYGAARTPHMFVIDPAGRVVYQGAIDNSPDGEGESPTGGKLVNYVDEALDATSRGEKVAVPLTDAYGCSVKYAAR